MNYQSALEYIHSLSRFAKKKGHDNIRKILSDVDNPHKSLKFIHVAGTNGKGSVAAYISSILKEEGYRVGTFVSPFIERFNERIQIDSNPISDDELSFYTQKIKSVCDKLTDVNPLEFEVITAIGFMYFLDKKCDVVVLETGLGGRLDSTNIIENPLIEVICQIGLDHTEILGDTIEKIALEKAGIIKDNSKVVFYPDNDDKAFDVIKNVCDKTFSELILPDINSLKILNTNSYGSDIVYKGMNIHIPLLGKHQIMNGICAVEAVKNIPMKVSELSIKNGIESTKWPCRFEIFGDEKNIVLDGAHNYPGILSLKNTLCDVFGDKKFIFVAGMLNDKEYKRSFDEILPLCDKLIITSVPSIRQINTEEIFSYAKGINKDTEYIEDNVCAIKKALEFVDKDSILCIFGSLYLVGNIRGYVKKL